MIFDRSLLKDISPFICETFLFDRTGTFHSLDGYQVLQPIPEPEKHDFTELCVSRAKELAKTDKKINVLWSGGADSTLLLLLLDQAGVPDEQITVLCSGDSYLINPEAGEIFIKKYQIDSPYIYSDKLRHFMSNDQMIISGIGMDMLTYGFDVQMSPENNLDDHVALLQERSSGTVEQYQAIFRKLEQASGYPCTTVKEYSRLKNLVLCWQPELLHIGTLANYGIYGQHFINFYQTKEFQQWALASHDTRTDNAGNKPVVSELIKTIDASCVPELKIQVPMMHRFVINEVDEVTDDWQYITRPYW